MADEDENKKLGSQINQWRKQSGITCSFVIFAALNIAMVVVGVKASNYCPVEPMITIYLMVAGSTSLSLLIVRLLVSHVLVPRLESSSEKLSIMEKSTDSMDNKSPLIDLTVRYLTIYDSLASIFSTAWLIAGSIYVYRSNPDYSDPNGPNYCLYDAYMFAFIVITIGYVSLGLSVVAAIFACLFKSRQSSFSPSY